MKPRFDLTPNEHLGSADTKQLLNRALFTEVAPKYDFVTRALSLGRDTAWKRQLIEMLPALPAPVCVDLACGTGDLSRLLARRYPRGQITGLDLTPAMLAIARQQVTLPNVSFVEGSMQKLPFEDGSVDIITGGYALRNAPALAPALEEIRRVLKPGATAAFLDFSKTPSRTGQAIGHMTLKGWGGFWGLVLHGNPDVYGYIADSLRLFPDRDALATAFSACGLLVRRRCRFYGGLLESLVLERCPQ